MSDSRKLEVRPGDTVFVCMADGHCNMHYIEHADSLEAMLQGFEQFLRGAGFSFDGHIDVCDSVGESQWAVDVRNFLDRITDPEVYGLLFVGQRGREVVEDAARLRDAR